MVKTIAIIFGNALSTAFFSIWIVIFSLIQDDDNVIHKIARVWARSILLISGVQVTVKGIENIDPEKSYIYMSNHQSNYDIPVLLAHLKVQFRWLAKSELFKIPIFGPAMGKAGYISIDRSDRRAAFLSLKKAAAAIRKGVSVMIFPEGTRSQDGNISAFKKGGFVLAIDSSAPIVPVVIQGTWSIMARTGLLIRPGKVRIDILKPIETKTYSRKNKDLLMNRVRQVAIEAFTGGKG
jgi:1-acyl-sn-glycerol-3-phosphate acyltransferase